MSYDPKRHHRQSIRLKGYDYTQAGAYFITINTHQNQHLLAAVEGNRLALTDAGRVVVETWNELPSRITTVQLDEFVVMPNHVHGILWLVGAAAGSHDGARDGGRERGVGCAASSAPTSVCCRGAVSSAPSVPSVPSVPSALSAPASSASSSPASSSPSLAEIVRAFKSISAINVNRLLGRRGVPVWQRNYYDRIIREELALHMSRTYIRNNPSQWIAGVHTRDENHAQEVAL